MATCLSSRRLSYPGRLFLWLLGYSFLLMAGFVVFQYHREKEFKTEEMNTRLQMINTYILAELGNGKQISDISLADLHPFEDIRISVIARDGTVVYDNSIDAVSGRNHRDREEIRQALATNTGYTVRRHSESTGRYYFYSATKGADGYVVRTAVPYSISLTTLLKPDISFLWVMGLIAIVMCVPGYFATRREGLNEQHEKERIRKQLTNNINHELKTPVASIKICVETLLAHRDLSEEKRGMFLQRCLANTERLQRLLADVSLITRMDDGPTSITREPVDLGELIRTAVDERRMMAGSKGMTIENEVVVPLPMTGSPSLLEAIFYNLIDNAIAYSGGTEIRIRLLHEDDRQIALSVSDNGVGVAREHLPRLFERFYRIDKGRSRAAGGTGLGLAIVKNAVLLHGGRISVENGHSGGLSFKIDLSRCDA